MFAEFFFYINLTTFSMWFAEGLFFFYPFFVYLPSAWGS